MKINIFTHLNGVGLEADYNLLKDLLTEHDVQVYNLHPGEVRSSDVSIHFEVPQFSFLRKSEKNIFVPNPEWFYSEWRDPIRQFTEVWAKTKYTYEVFKGNIHFNTKLSGFVSKDLYDPQIQKKKCLIHVAGKSSYKNTDMLCEAYRLYDDLPRCFLVSSKQYPVSNKLVNAGRLDDADFKTLVNACLIHICPSQAEGWGHYIHEAMGCSNVVITSDFAPMNENHIEYLVPCKEGKKRQLSKSCDITPKDLYNTIMSVYEKSNVVLIESGKNNRSLFEQEVTNFKQFLKENL